MPFLNFYSRLKKIFELNFVDQEVPSFDKYSLEELKELEKILDTDEETFFQKVLGDKYKKDFSEEDKMEIEDAFYDAILRKVKGNQEEEESEEEVEEEPEEKDYTKPESWYFYGYEIEDLEKLKKEAKENPEEFKKRFDIANDEEFNAALISLDKALGELKKAEEEEEEYIQKNVLKSDKENEKK